VRVRVIRKLLFYLSLHQWSLRQSHLERGREGGGCGGAERDENFFSLEFPVLSLLACCLPYRAARQNSEENSPAHRKILKRNVLHVRTASSENATSPKSTKSRNSDSLKSRGTNSSCDFGFIETCTENCELFDSVDFGVVALSVESVIGNFETESRSCLLYCAEFPEEFPGNSEKGTLEYQEILKRNLALACSISQNFLICA